MVPHQRLADVTVDALLNNRELLADCYRLPSLRDLNDRRIRLDDEDPAFPRARETSGGSVLIDTILRFQIPLDQIRVELSACDLTTDEIRSTYAQNVRRDLDEQMDADMKQAILGITGIPAEMISTCTPASTTSMLIRNDARFTQMVYSFRKEIINPPVLKVSFGPRHTSGMSQDERSDLLVEINFPCHLEAEEGHDWPWILHWCLDQVVFSAEAGDINQVRLWKRTFDTLYRRFKSNERSQNIDMQELDFTPDLDQPTSATIPLREAMKDQWFVEIKGSIPLQGRNLVGHDEDGEFPDYIRNQLKQAYGGVITRVRGYLLELFYSQIFFRVAMTKEGLEEDLLSLLSVRPANRGSTTPWSYSGSTPSEFMSNVINGCIVFGVPPDLIERELDMLGNPSQLSTQDIIQEISTCAAALTLYINRAGQPDSAPDNSSAPTNIIMNQGDPREIRSLEEIQQTREVFVEV